MKGIKNKVHPNLLQAAMSEVGVGCCSRVVGEREIWQWKSMVLPVTFPWGQEGAALFLIMSLCIGTYLYRDIWISVSQVLVWTVYATVFNFLPPGIRRWRLWSWGRIHIMDPVKLMGSALVSRDLFHLHPGTIALQVTQVQWWLLLDVYFANYRHAC